MRVLILGGAGMLGHKLWQFLNPRTETWVTFRGNVGDYARFELFDSKRAISGISAADHDGLVSLFARIHPELVVNCIGIIKQLPQSKSPLPAIAINALLPHQLANLCGASGARLIHMSTDCVFSGRDGRYAPDADSDATDLYGRTKYLGEVEAPHAVTIRSSIIGRELATTSGLVEWFLSNRGGKVKGFSKAIYSGFTTQVMARLIWQIAERHPSLSGVQQVASKPIDKYSLLQLVRDAFGADVSIEPNDDLRIDRSLDGSRFEQETGFKPPSWHDMVNELAADPTPYDRWRDDQ